MLRILPLYYCAVIAFFVILLPALGTRRSLVAVAFLVLSLALFASPSRGAETVTVDKTFHGREIKVRVGATIRVELEPLTRDHSLVDRLVELGQISSDLARRQHGLGAGPRMKLEHDAAQILGGVMEGLTTGGPISMLILNADHAKWRGGNRRSVQSPGQFPQW